MEEKKKFILAIPTIIIIIATIVGVFLIFYNRNLKKMDRESMRMLSQKVTSIDNISCEIVTQTTQYNNTQTVIDYKLKDNKLINKSDYYTTYEDENEKVKIQIDESEKTAYVYKDYVSEITVFKEMLCTAEKILESEEYSYDFLKYETMNGIKCASFSVSNSDTTFNIWLDRSNGMIVKMDCHYHMEGTQNVDTTMYYRYQINNVTDDDVKKPNLESYSIIEL